jgi:YD repeat-containing protein
MPHPLFCKYEFLAPDGSANTYNGACPERSRRNNLNRLTTLANSWAGSFGFSYDALSRRTQMTRPNGVKAADTTPAAITVPLRDLV